MIESMLPTEHPGKGAGCESTCRHSLFLTRRIQSKSPKATSTEPQGLRASSHDALPGPSSCDFTTYVCHVHIHYTGLNNSQRCGPAFFLM